MNMLDDDCLYLYHCTYSGRLPGIVRHGLCPGQRGSIGNTAYDQHRKGGIFLTTGDGVIFWFGKLEEWANHYSDSPLEDGLTPFVLRVDIDDLQQRAQGEKPRKKIIDMCKVDELGTRDASGLSLKCKAKIPARMLEVWTGSEWEPVSIATLDDEGAYEHETVEDDDSEEGYYIYSYLLPHDSNPFYPPNDALEDDC